MFDPLSACFPVCVLFSSSPAAWVFVTNVSTEVLEEEGDDQKNPLYSIFFLNCIPFNI